MAATPTRPSLSTLTINVKVLEGRNLIAKDRSLLGKRSTSDTYVKVYSHFDETGTTTLLGQTKVVPKSLNPVFQGETFQFQVGADSTRKLLKQNGGVQLQLKLFDHDKVGGDDPMGTVVIELKPLEGEQGAKWYPVGKGSGSTFCRNAKGDLLVQTEMVAHEMRDLSRGQTTMLNAKAVKVGLAWDVERGNHIDLDCSCIAVGREGEIVMDETVYYGNLNNHNHSIRHSGDESTGAATGDDETINVDLDHIPQKVLALYFLLTVAQDSARHTLAQIKSAQVRLIDAQTKQGLCRIVPHEFGANTALFLFRLARSTTTGKWMLTCMEEGDPYARDFGSLIPEIKGYTRDLVPNIHIDKNERVAVMRKGGTIRVADYSPTGVVPNQVTFGLAWDVTNGVNIDLDASAIMMDSDYNLVDLVSFSHLASNDGSIRHSGDEREGDEAGDDEKIHVSLATVHPAVKYIGFVINSYSRQELDDVDRAACHLFDSHTHRDIASYTLVNARELDKHTALVMGCLYRGEDGWYLRIISLPSQGTMAKDNVGDLRQFLQNNPPPPPSTPPPEPEIVLNAMPDAEVQEEEIDLSKPIPQSEFQNYVEDEEIDLSSPLK